MNATCGSRRSRRPSWHRRRRNCDPKRANSGQFLQSRSRRAAPTSAGERNSQNAVASVIQRIGLTSLLERLGNRFSTIHQFTNSRIHQFLQRRPDRRRREALAQEGLIETRHLGPRGDARSPAQLLLDRARDQGALVHVAEHVADRFGRDLARDPLRAELLLNAKPAAPLHLERRRRVLARAGARWRPRPVPGRDRDRAGGCASAGPRGPGGRAGGGRRGRPRAYPPKRTMSGFDGVRAISSRVISVVVETPCTLSLNSSTFEAQRSASSSVT